MATPLDLRNFLETSAECLGPSDLDVGNTGDSGVARPPREQEVEVDAFRIPSSAATNAAAEPGERPRYFF